MQLPQELILIVCEKNRVVKTFGKKFSDLDGELLTITNKYQLWDNYIWDQYSIECAIRANNLQAVKWLAKEKPLIFKTKVTEYALEINSDLNMIKCLLGEKPQLLNDGYSLRCMETVIKQRDQRTFEYLFPIYIEKFPETIYQIMNQIGSWGAGRIAEWVVDNYPNHANYVVTGLVDFIRNT